MGLESIIGGIITLLLVVVPFVISRLNNRRDNQNAQGSVDDATLRDSMDRADKLFPPAK